MFIFKLKNNNRGYSTINWAILIMLTLFALCMILDLANLFVAKNIVINRVTYLSGIATVQGGLGPSQPYGWGDLYSAPYISGNEARATFVSALNSYAFIDSADLSGLGYVGYQSEGVLTGQATYRPYFTGGLGAPTVNLSHNARFVGFWIYRSTHV